MEQQIWWESTLKTCKNCLQEKDLTEYYKRKGTKDGRYGVCKVCAKEYQAEKRRADPEKYRKQCADWYENNKEYAKEMARKWLADNKDRRAAYVRANSEKAAAHTAKRRAMYKHGVEAMPDEELEEVQYLYWLAKDLGVITGEKYHVDHIIPLSKGGEHRLHNLQILPAEVNLRKSDKIWHVR